MKGINQKDIFPLRLIIRDIMGLFKDLFGNDKKKSQQAAGLLSFMDQEQKNDSNYTDEELNDYGLSDDEMKHVKNEDYDPWNFDEEDLEDDDYYNEDDD